MKRIHIFTLLLIIILSSIICSYKLLEYYSVKMSPVVFSYAESEVKKLTTLIINKSIDFLKNKSYNYNVIKEVIRNGNDLLNLIRCTIRGGYHWNYYNSKKLKKLFKKY